MSKKRIDNAKDPLSAFIGRTLALQSFRLTEMSAKCSLVNNNSDALPSHIHLNANVKSGTPDGHMAFLNTFELKGSYDDNESSAALLISATFATLYSIDSLEEINSSDVQKFGQIAVIYLLWPFWRELVQSTTARMSLPPLTLPLHAMGSLEFSADSEVESAGKRNKVPNAAPTRPKK